MIAFLDASALIYLLEGEPALARRAHAELAALAQTHAGLRVAVSRLSWLECRVGPMKADELARLALFDAFFARPDLVWLELTREVVELAAAIRARHGLRTPDALQAACCLQLGPGHVLLTGDAAFRRVAGLNVAVLAPFAPRR
ncbi:PIN domain-containing protein [Comamonas sp. NLF-1-9]|uniref:type II toxin-antitoxin system VapC family toxin n=1 Tax=Comamonas sp. NLF-1-9 TaxID=2853163 RepID=UPI001C4511F2|nr:PIN domain-containing protein [Comamonas sp. NLF-1-9]QXL83515.1 PIN domain-containing protein [Comamonas sp. NLF-1-9]